MSESQIAAMTTASCRPEGTVEFAAAFPGLHDPAQPDGTLFELVTGAHVLRLSRKARLLRAYHSSPGTGTRVATIRLATLAPAEMLHVFLCWSPQEFRLAVGEAQGTRLIQETGEVSQLQLWVDAEGRVWEVGGTDVAVSGARVYSDGVPLISPPAMELWRSTLVAVDLLMSGESSAGFAYEAVLSNAVLGMLVTGYETYCQQRFSEVEREGVPPDAERLVQKCGARDQRDQLKRGKLRAVLSELCKKDPCVSSAMVNQINFQDFERCKTAYAAAFGIRFGCDLGVSSQLVARVRKLIKYRHRIVHVSPLLGTLNLPDVPPKEPEFATKTFASEAKTTVDRFINALHARTLDLRPADLGPNESV
jgi:hypothetical protein